MEFGARKKIYRLQAGSVAVLAAGAVFLINVFWQNICWPMFLLGTALGMVISIINFELLVAGVSQMGKKKVNGSVLITFLMKYVILIGGLAVTYFFSTECLFGAVAALVTQVGVLVYEEGIKPGKEGSRHDKC